MEIEFFEKARVGQSGAFHGRRQLHLVAACAVLLPQSLEVLEKRLLRVPCALSFMACICMYCDLKRHRLKKSVLVEKRSDGNLLACVPTPCVPTTPLPRTPSFLQELQERTSTHIRASLPPRHTSGPFFLKFTRCQTHPDLKQHALIQKYVPPEKSVTFLLVEFLIAACENLLFSTFLCGWATGAGT